MIEFLCSNKDCRAELTIGDELAGKKVKCPKCRTVMVVPRPDSGTDASDSTGYEATMALEEELVEEEQQEEGGVEALEAELEQTRRLKLPYQAEKEVARGGMGAILLAQDKAIQRELAVKVMRPEVADSEEHRLRFLEEAQVTGQLEHPNIVPIHELGKDADGNLYFTMKLVKGKSLGDIVRELKDSGDGPTLSELLGVYLKICDGIAFAHSKGVIHRDLKPDNIMVGEFGEVQIMDWGLAKVLGEKEQSGPEAPAGEQAEATESAIRRADTVKSVRTESDVALTVDGQITGTPAYMPPEQAEGKLELIDHRSDVYSLGAILYEILTLERPIEGDTVHKVLLNVSEGKITPPEQRTPERHIPKELSAVVMKATVKNRRKRYQSVQGLGQDIKLFLEGRSVSAKEDSFVEAFAKLVKRNRAASIAAGVALLVVLAVGTAFTIDNAKKRRIAEEARDAAIEAQEKQRETALTASMELALQAVRAAEGGEIGEAEFRAEAAAKVAPDGPWGHYAWGKIALEKKDYETAEEELQEARKINPDDERIKSALAQALALLGKIEEAERIVRDVKTEKDWYVLRAAGDAFFKAERYRDAEKAYLAAIERLDDPQRVPKGEEDWRPVLEKADTLFGAGLYPDAKAAYGEVLKMLETARVAPPGVALATKEKVKSADAAVVGLKQDLETAIGNARAWIKCEGFYESIRFLPPDEQFKRIVAKFEGLHGQKIEIRPYIVDDALQRVDFRHPEKVKYLHPLKGMQLTYMYHQGMQVSDLSPLRGMPMATLNLWDAPVRDLGPLRGMPLTLLFCNGTRVVDLRPLKGIALERLQCGVTRVSDLSPLAGMPLKNLFIRNTQVKSLVPLSGMRLESLDCMGTMVTDLSPLKGMPLQSLGCSSTRITDLSPLKGMPLKSLCCDGCRVTDLSPLRGMRLTYLTCNNTGVSDLSPLKGMPLRVLEINGNSKIAGLTPLGGMPLKQLGLEGTNVTDLSPLDGTELRRLTFSPGRIARGIEVARQMKTIKEIGIYWSRLMSPDEFWKKYDAGEFK